MDARARLATCIVIGVIAFIPTVILTAWQVAVLVGWDATAAAFLVLIWLAVRGRDSLATKELATTVDDSRVAAELILVAASVVSLVGVGLLLLSAAGSKGAAHFATIGVAILSVVLSWACVHAVFTLRYARLYYSGRGGIDYHNNEAPDYGDFAYVALTIGMTFQVSDTDLTSRQIRRSAIRHALLSYLFGVVIVAMVINVVASLLTK
jgi:uncharacterized membrane protein